jgi:hypothetical protein
VEQSCSFFHVAAADWTALNGFARAAGLQLLFDLNVLLRNGTEWDSSNARQLLDFSDKHRYNISWQLGNGTVLLWSLYFVGAVSTCHHITLPYNPPHPNIYHHHDILFPVHD